MVCVFLFILGDPMYQYTLYIISIIQTPLTVPCEFWRDKILKVT